MFAKINEFAFRNLDKAVMIETRDNKYVGTLVDCVAEKFILLEDCIGITSISMYDIVGYHIIKNKESKMSPERFKELLDELDGNSLNTLKEKNARYATDGDRLHNFRSGAEIAGGTPAQACWGYMTKHLTALRDMVMKNDFSNREDFLEKCQDTINYIRFLWCIGNDASNSEDLEFDNGMSGGDFDGDPIIIKDDKTYLKCPYIQHFREDEPGCKIIGIGHCKGNGCYVLKNIKKESN